MKIIFRTDSSYQIGTGHVMRCLTLAQELRNNGFEVIFICRELTGNIITTIKEKKFPVYSLPSLATEDQSWLGTSQENDLRDCLAILKAMNDIEYLIVDHYGLDIEWEKPIRSYTKKIIVIDDLANRKHDCDLLLDQNLYNHSHTRYKNKVSPDTKLLLGPSFALLRSEFHEARSALKHRNGEINRILVSLGGTDPDNITKIILQGIQISICKNLEIDIILGSHSQHRDNIKQICDENFNFHLHINPKNIAELMVKADLAIGAGGTTTWERCALGLPSLVVKIASNQDDLIKHGFSANILEYAGDVETINSHALAQKINELVNNPSKLLSISQNGSNLVDGLGVRRVLHELKLYTKEV